MCWVLENNRVSGGVGTGDKADRAKYHIVRRAEPVFVISVNKTCSENTECVKVNIV